MDDLRKLTDDELQNKLRSFAAEARKLQLETIRHLREVERRMLHAKRGYNSLYEYCVKELHFSEGSAYRRIASMRLLQEIPESTAKLENGELNLTTATLAHQYFQRNRTLSQTAKMAFLESVTFKTRKQTEEQIRRAEGMPTDLLFVRLALTESLRKKLELVKQNLRLAEHARLEEILETLVDRTLQKFTQREAGPARESTSRYIPAPVKVMVWKRDAGTCTYTDPSNSKRCGARYSLQFDHIIPFSAGGKSNVENLRLLCPVHNQLHALETIGVETMQKFLPKLC